MVVVRFWVLWYVYLLRRENWETKKRQWREWSCDAVCSGWDQVKIFLSWYCVVSLNVRNTDIYSKYYSRVNKSWETQIQKEKFKMAEITCFFFFDFLEITSHVFFFEKLVFKDEEKRFVNTRPISWISTKQYTNTHTPCTAERTEWMQVSFFYVFLVFLMPSFFFIFIVLCFCVLSTF